MQILSDIFFALLRITGILVLLTIIIAIISTPFVNARNKKFAEELEKQLCEAIEEVKKEQSKKTTKKKKKKDEE